MANIFLDLEGTIIDLWSNPVLVNNAEMRQFLTANAVTEVRLFSFAVWSEFDQNVFNTQMKAFLEDKLSVKILDCPTVFDFMKADTKVTGVNWWQDDIHDFITMRGKVDAFRSWCRLHFDRQENILIDDVVPNLVCDNRDTGLVLEFINVNNLVDRLGDK